MKVKEVIKRLEAEGWVLERQRASHGTFKKSGVAAVVTISGIDGKDVPPG